MSHVTHVGKALYLFQKLKPLTFRKRGKRFQNGFPEGFVRETARKPKRRPLFEKGNLFRPLASNTSSLPRMGNAREGAVLARSWRFFVGPACRTQARAPTQPSHAMMQAKTMDPDTKLVSETSLRGLQVQTSRMGHGTLAAKRRLGQRITCTPRPLQSPPPQCQAGPPRGGGGTVTM